MVIVHTGAETIQGWKLYEEIRYSVKSDNAQHQATKRTYKGSVNQVRGIDQERSHKIEASRESSRESKLVKAYSLKKNHYIKLILFS